MALRLSSPPLSSSSKSHLSNLFLNSRFFTRSSSPLQWRSINAIQFSRRGSAGVILRACAKMEEKNVSETGKEWGKVSAVLFDMDGVLCNSEEVSRLAAVDVFAEMGVEVSVEDFVPFMGTGEANFLGGVASIKGVKEFNTEEAKKRFFEIYLDKYAKPNSGIGFPGALELIVQCKNSGLKVAVASSADRIKVDANLVAAGLPMSMFGNHGFDLFSWSRLTFVIGRSKFGLHSNGFDAIVSADAFENLKPAPDIFLAAAKNLNVPTSECIVIEDALAGVQAAKAAQMRCIAVTTTLSEDTLKSASPSLIRNEIGNILLDDILSGSSCSDKPSGIVEAGNGKLFIADTNSLIRYLDLNKQEDELLTLELKGVQPPTLMLRYLKRLRSRSAVHTETIKVDGGSSNEGVTCISKYQYLKGIISPSKYGVEIEPEDAVIIDPLDGNLSAEGTAMLHFKRSSPSASTGKINCKV